MTRPGSGGGVADMAYAFRLALFGTPRRLDFRPPCAARLRLGTGRGLPLRFMRRGMAYSLPRVEARLHCPMLGVMARLAKRLKIERLIAPALAARDSMMDDELCALAAALAFPARSREGFRTRRRRRSVTPWDSLP
jgi:hypothetical protein